VLGGHIEDGIGSEQPAQAAALRWFQASKKRLMAVLASGPVDTLAARVPAAALRSVAAMLPARDGWPELPVQPARDRIRAGTITSPATAARPRSRVTMPWVCAHGS